MERHYGLKETSRLLGLHPMTARAFQFSNLNRVNSLMVGMANARVRLLEKSECGMACRKK